MRNIMKLQKMVIGRIIIDGHISKNKIYGCYLHKENYGKIQQKEAFACALYPLEKAYDKALNNYYNGV